jgi:hypothetical protein
MTPRITPLRVVLAAVAILVATAAATAAAATPPSAEAASSGAPRGTAGTSPAGTERNRPIITERQRRAERRRRAAALRERRRREAMRRRCGAADARDCRRLYYRVAVTAKSTSRFETKDRSGGRLTTYTKAATWFGRSPGAATVSRHAGPGGSRYGFLGRVAGLVTSASGERVSAPAGDCSPTVETWTPLIFPDVSGQVLLRLGPGERQATVAPLRRGAEDGLSRYLNSGTTCTDPRHNVAPRDDEEPGLGPYDCGKDSKAAVARSVDGSVSFGEPFTITSRCHSEQNRTGSFEEETLDYRFEFTPCPKRGLDVRNC